PGSGCRRLQQSQQIFEVLFPIERREIVELFAGTYEARGNSKFILDRYDYATFAATIEFRHDQTSESKRVVKFACLTKRVAAGSSIDDEQRLLRCVRIKFAQSAFYLVQLGHQICFRVLPAGCVTKQKVNLPLGSCLIRFVTKRRGICAVLAANDFNAESLCPDVELLDSRGAKRVCCGKHRLRSVR